VSGRIYLSPPHLSGREREYLNEALDSNWVAPLGPHVDAFEAEFARKVGVPHAAALSSGTAAVHLGLQLLGVEAGEEVLCASLTFAASANPVVHLGARPVFVDAERDSWNLDPGLLEEELAACARRGRVPRVLVAVDLYGDCADYGRIVPVCEEYGVAILEDAAEALGSSWNGRMAGSFGRAGVFSFNGNKIITTSGGGMLVSEDGGLVERARYLATQARERAPHYEHVVAGYNYRMSNLLAGVGRAQLAVLEERVAARRRNRAYYEEALSGMEGVSFMPVPAGSHSNCWLTCILVDPEDFGASAAELRVALEEQDIEARPVWKPLHLQKSFDGCRVVGGGNSEELFVRGLCLPSGSALSEADLERVCEVVCRVHRRARERMTVANQG